MSVVYDDVDTRAQSVCELRVKSARGPMAQREQVTVGGCCERGAVPIRRQLKMATSTTKRQLGRDRQLIEDLTDGPGHGS